MTNICIIGLGRIGLPLALVSAKAGHNVIGVENNLERIYNIKNNNIHEPQKDLTRKLFKEFFGKNFFITDDLKKALKKSEIVLITIGTSKSDDKTPNISSIYRLIDDICKNLENIKGKLFIFKTTLPIGTVRKIVKIIEEKTSLECGKDYFVAFCPERVLGNKAIIEMPMLPKIIGGLDIESSRRAAEFYKTIGGKIIIVDTPEAAELIKLIDNAYRQTIFAFSNDIALIAERYGLNAYEIIKAANDSYPRNNVPPPSVGVSGYCLTKDPIYLETSFRDITKERGFHSVWFCARMTNDYMPIHTVDLLNRELSRLNSNLKDSNILVCGISYKENTDDIRDSHGIEIAKKLNEMGANVFIWDPNIHLFNLKYTKVNDPYDVIENMDALVFTVKHDEFIKLNENKEVLNMLKKMRKPIIVDGWGIFTNLKKEKTINYVGIGIARQPMK